MAGSRLSKQARVIFYDPNKEALKSFLKRKVRGMDLSARIWKTLDPFKREMEQALGMMIHDGLSARAAATRLKGYLKDPDRLYRRVMGEDGKLRLSARARAYHPGRGVYRSSYKNAFRLARTETNMAFRTADFQRWQNLPFVTGIEIKLSNNHPKYDICDVLAGKYPKDFMFRGWHPQCLCHVVPVMLSDEEYSKLEDKILAGERVAVPKRWKVNDPPATFHAYVRQNKDRIASWKSTPYWVKDNQKYYKQAAEVKASPLPTSTTQGRPGGLRIGTQFTKLEKAVEQNVRAALDHIDSVHGDGSLNDIPFQGTYSQDYQAAFAMMGKTPLRIELSRYATDPELSIIHEMGHFLDFTAIGAGEFASKFKNTPAGKVVAAAKETDEIKHLHQILRTGYAGIRKLNNDEKAHIKYLLSDYEIFARAYAQYIATKTKNPVLLEGVKRRVDHFAVSGYRSQWVANDFERIEKAMDEMMAELGWRVSR